MNPQERPKRKPRTNQPKWTVKDLPDLIEFDRTDSLSHSKRLWALDFVNPANLGSLKPMTEQGLLLQNSGDNSVRCIYAVDHFEVKILLAMLVSTFNSIGVTVDLGDYTVIVPFEGEEEVAEEANDEVISEKIVDGFEVA